MKDGLPIYAQLRDQIRALILRGDLESGHKLPSVRQLASYLSINRHTVSRAMDDLESEGLIVRELGRGTYVADTGNTVHLRSSQLLAQIVEEAIQRSQSLGYSSSELLDAIREYSENETQSQEAVLNIGFVECNWASANRYAVDLHNELGVAVKPLLLSDIQEQVAAGAHPDEQFDIIVTTVGHFPEVRRALGSKARICSITGGPYMKVFFEVLKLAADKKIGIVTASDFGSTGMKQAMVQAGIPAERISTASLEQPTLIPLLIANIDALVISNTAMEAVKETVDVEHLTVLEYQNQLDATSVEALRRILQDIAEEKATVAEQQRQSLLQVAALDLQRAMNVAT